MPGGLRFREGKGSPFADQDSIGRDAHRRVVVEADPSSTLEVAKSDFLLQVQIISLGTPAHNGDVDKTVERDVLRQRREPELRRLLLVLRAKNPATGVPLVTAMLGLLPFPGAASFWPRDNGAGS